MPSVWLQQHLWDASHVHWYDYAAWAVYMTHFFAVWITAAVLWRVARERFRRFAVTAVLLSLWAFATYWAYPAQPPWLAGDDGLIPHVDRVVPAVWGHLGVQTVQSTYENSGFVNTVAAMPSLHAAFPLMLLLFFWSAGRWVRLGLGLYTLAMAFTLVYGGEHFVADIVAGWAMALGVHALVSVGFRRAPALCALEAAHAERLLHVRGRAVAAVDVDLPRLDDEPPAVVVEAEVALVEVERHRLLLARIERHPLEAAQAAHRLRDARDRVVDVELRHVVTGAVARVGDVHRAR